MYLWTKFLKSPSPGFFLENENNKSTSKLKPICAWHSTWHSMNVDKAPVVVIGSCDSAAMVTLMG